MSAIPKSEESILLREDRDGICILTMNRPSQMNLLTTEMLEALQEAFDAIAGDQRVRAVVLAAAVVAKPDAKWGETPCAFVELKPGAQVSEMELIEFCRGQLARFKAPRAVVFGELPKTSTGKIQKFVLRDKAKSATAIDT